MKTFFKCSYYDCGWCYAPPHCNPKDDDGECNNMEDCHCSTEVNVVTYKFEDEE